MRDSHLMYPTITIVFGHLPRTPGRMSFLLNCASVNLEAFFFLQLQAYGFCSRIQTQKKNQSLLDPHGLY